MLLTEELAAMIAAEEERLGVGSKDFQERHKDIMESVDRLLSKRGDEDGMC